MTDQNPVFGIRQIVDMVLKALSSGINDHADSGNVRELLDVNSGAIDLPAVASIALLRGRQTACARQCPNPRRPIG